MKLPPQKKQMSTITTKDWTAQPVVLSHGWPLNADPFEDPIFFASRGCRRIAHDSRGHRNQISLVSRRHLLACKSHTATTHPIRK